MRHEPSLNIIILWVKQVAARATESIHVYGHAPTIWAWWCQAVSFGRNPSPAGAQNVFLGLERVVYVLVSGEYLKTPTATLFADPSIPTTIVSPFSFLLWEGGGKGKFPISAEQGPSAAVPLDMVDVWFHVWVRSSANDVWYLMVISADLRRTRIERIFWNLPRWKKSDRTLWLSKIREHNSCHKNNIQQQSSEWFKKATWEAISRATCRWWMLGKMHYTLCAIL